MTNREVDPNEAPDGYYAVHSPEANCKGCAFEHIAAFRCSVYPCNATHRKDGLNVVYRPKAHSDLREAVDVIRWLVDEHKHARLEAKNFLKKYSEANNE